MHANEPLTQHGHIVTSRQDAINQIKTIVGTPKDFNIDEIADKTIKFTKTIEPLTGIQKDGYIWTVNETEFFNIVQEMAIEK